MTGKPHQDRPGRCELRERHNKQLKVGSERKRPKQKQLQFEDVGRILNLREGNDGIWLLRGTQAGCGRLAKKQRREDRRESKGLQEP